MPSAQPNDIVYLGARIPRDLLARLDRQAEAEGRTRSNFLRRLLTEALCTPHHRRTREVQ